LYEAEERLARLANGLHSCRIGLIADLLITDLRWGLYYGTVRGRRFPERPVLVQFEKKIRIRASLQRCRQPSKSSTAFSRCELNFTAQRLKPVSKLRSESACLKAYPDTNLPANCTTAERLWKESDYRRSMAFR
jgi:hypothetical protein